MTSFLGHVEEFVPGQTSWELYLERLEFYFEANGIEEPDKKRAVLLSVCGPATYSLIRSLLMPKRPSEFTYAEVLRKISEHFVPKPSEIVQRYTFNKRNQRHGESIADYVAELRKLSEHCNFGETLDLMLRDRLVCGIAEEALQRRLLAEVDLTFKKALDIVVATETAQKHVSTIRHAQMQMQDVNRIQKKWHQQKPTSQSRLTSQQESKPQRQSSEGNRTCFRCGGSHAPDTCRFANSECHYCKKKGHIESVCLSKKRGKNCNSGKTTSSSKQTHNVGFVQQRDQHFDFPQSTRGDEGPYFLNQVGESQLLKSVTVQVLLNGVAHTMEVDSGAACTIIDEHSFHKLWPTNPPTMADAEVTLRTWSHETLPVLGSTLIDVELKGVKQVLPLLVVKGQGTSLLGRNWFTPLGIHIAGINQVQPNFLTSTPELQSVFGDDLGCYCGPPVRVEIDSAVAPKYFKSRPIPFAIRPKVDEELDRLVKQGVLEPVTTSDWATPIVPVVKKNGTLRLCGDYRATVNTAIKVDRYPLPSITEILATLAGGKKFSKLDLAQAYQQVTVDDTTAKLLTINTPKGLFKVKRLAFGIASAPGIFQRLVEGLVAGIPGVVAYQDDILVSGISDAQLNERQLQVISRIKDAGLRLKRDKCEFNVDFLDYLGFRVDSQGVHPTQEKVLAIHNAPTPCNKEQVQAYLGLLNFYACFLENKATIVEPLHRLLNSDSKWNWTKEHADAFAASKALLQSEAILTHFDGSKPIVLACDASSYGLGAVLSHVDEAGEEAPIAFASRTMSTTERNYAHIDREALSVIYGVKKFHQYVYGRSFKIITDHKPLLGLFHPTRQMAQVLSPRMLRWSLLLSAYSYTIEYRPGKRHGNADGLSRLPMPTDVPDYPPPGDILLLEGVHTYPLTSNKIAQLTRRDPILARVIRWVQVGWPSDYPTDEFKPFLTRRDELSVHKDCLLWGTRVVVPGSASSEVLAMLHAAHPGIVNMKALARSYVWWPKMDSEIETCVKKCNLCQTTRSDPKKAPVHSWEWPKKPWSRLHMDFAGPFQGQTFLLVVDSHSKWLEVFPVSSVSTKAVMDKLRPLFATHGLPDTIVSDNGSAFTSSEFSEFLKKNGIRGTLVAPYHPSSNGQAERVVQTTKQALRRILTGDWTTRLSRFLLSQHNTPSATTGTTPAELLMGRKLKTALDLLHPDTSDCVQRRSVTNSQPRTFVVGDPVFARNFHSGPKWIPATVLKITGPLSYVVQCSDGRSWRRHIDQLRSRITDENEQKSQVPKDSDWTAPVTGDAPEVPHFALPDPPVLDPLPDLPVLDPLRLPVVEEPRAALPLVEQPNLVRRPERIRHPPAHLQDFVLNLPGVKEMSCSRSSTSMLCTL